MTEHPFGQRIHNKRLDRLAQDPRFTLRQLAARLGIQPSYLSRLERGAAPSLSEEHILALARELDDDPDVLLALAGKLPGDVRRALLAAPERLLPLVRALDQPCWLGPDARNTPPQFWDSYRESQHLARVGSFVRDLETGEDFWSEEFFRIFGLPAGGPAPTFDAFLALVHPDDRPAVAEVRQRLYAGGEPIHYTYRFRRGDGLWRHAKAVARCQCDAAGRGRRILGTVQDVTTERQALEDLRAVAQFPEDNPGPVLRVNREGRLAYANRAGTPLLDASGLAVGEPVGPPLADAVRAALASAAPREIDMAVGGGVQRLTVVPRPLSGQANIYGRDVTEELAAKAALEAARRDAGQAGHMLQAVLDASPDTITFVSADGRILRANAAMARAVLGSTAGDDPARLVGLHRNDIFGPETREAVEREDQAAMDLGQPCHSTRPMAFAAGDGGVRQMLISRSPLRNDAGEVVGFCAIGRDVTDWHDAAQALAASEARSQRIINDAVLGVFRATADGRVLTVNPAMARLFGYDSPEEMLALAGHDAGALYQNPKRRREIVRRLTNKEGLLNFETPYRRKDGSTFIGNLHARLAVDADGQRCIEGFIEDITGRKRVQAALAASEERLKTHLRNFPLPTFTFSLRGRQLVLADANKAAEALFRGRIGACLDSPAEVVFEEAPDIYLALWSAFEGRRGERRRLTLRPPGADEPGLFDMTFVFVSPDTVMLHAEEITAVARMREDLNRTSEQLRSILDHVPCAVYFKDTSGRCIMVNRAVEEIFGRPAVEVVNQTPGAIHDPEVAARIADDDRRVLASGRPETFEEDIVARGRTRRFLTTKVPLADARGEPYALCGMSLDITERLALEREIQAERDTLRTILAHVPYAAILVTADGRIPFVNQRFIDLVGYTLDDIPTAADWMPRAYPDPSLRARVEADWQAAQGTACRRIYPVHCADGRSRWIDFKCVPLPDGRMLLTLTEADPRPLLGNGPDRELS